MIDNKLNTNNNRWKGFKKATVLKIVQEDENVKSFYLKLADESSIPSFTAGQFIAVRVKNEDGSYTKVRQYTLSTNYREEYYRISVKREVEGNLSKKLCDEIKEGDTIEITSPMGNFVLKESERPLVLLGGGIGVTPMLAMAYDTMGKEREVQFIYSIPNGKNHSFKGEIEEIGKYPNVKNTIFYTRPTEGEKIGFKFDKKGRISKLWMEENLPKDGEFYFCGPVPFMKEIYSNLIEMKISEEQINYEMFGSQGESLK